MIGFGVDTKTPNQITQKSISISIVIVKLASLLHGSDTVLITTEIKQTRACAEFQIGIKILYLGLPKMGDQRPLVISTGWKRCMQG